MKPYSAVLKHNTLTIANSLIARQYRWNDGQLVSQKLTDKRSGHVWELDEDTPDFFVPGVESKPSSGNLVVVDVPANGHSPAHGRVEVCFRLGCLEVRRVFRIYADCPAIACSFYLKGNTAPAGLPQSTIERVAFGRHHLRLTCVQFLDVTDRHNNLVQVRTFVPYRSESHLTGNLMLIQDVLNNAGLFILKEAPCSDAQLAWPGYDFVSKTGTVSLAGLGVTAGDVGEDGWTRCYGFVTGMATGSEHALLEALRTYQNNTRIRQPGRDEMILLNTWGDRSQDTRLGESFALAELEAASRLGVTHFQLDDGWQKGRTSNSAFAGGTLAGIWDRTDFWDIHPERFPRGLAPIVQRSRELGIQLGLWFSPSKDRSYENWQKDADVLIALYRQQGIRTFKIDGVNVLDKRGETNLRSMFDAVLEATGGDAMFNLDITNGHRFGYHYFTEYGNLFLENRYTDWSNYYPHWTLRNLWMLSRYVPPQRLQIEFLNKWRNADKYGEDDRLAPACVPFDYCFAITMMAQPLAWFEAACLPQEAFAVAPLMKQYRRHQERIHAGNIFPIGEEPSGTGWTGFQSIASEDAGYLLVFRELNERPSARLGVWNLAGRRMQYTHVLGHGRSFRGKVTDDGRISVRLPTPLSFALYKYRSV